jgi:DUF1680 family protein
MFRLRWIALALVPAALLSAASPPPAVEDKVRDQFVPAPYQVQKIDGLLGRRLATNLEGRLLHVDEQGIIAGFEKRPGSHAWIGEHAGKYLHAAVNTWLYSGDVRLKSQMDRIARRLIAGQLADGYLGTYTDDKRWTSWDVWVHKYDLIGLLTYYQATGHAPALETARRVGDLLCLAFGAGPGQRDIIQSSTHVGMAAMSVLEPMVMLYRYTGEPRYLDFCRYLVHAYDQPQGPKIVTSLNATGSVFKTANAKAYEMMSNLVGLVDLYRMTGESAWLAPAVTAWNDIASRRLYVTGTTSSKEHFLDDFDLPGDEKANVGEGCATVTWLQLSWQLLRVTGEAKYAEELERTVYNQLLGAQDPHNGNICYFTPLQGKKKPGPGINCCVSSEPRGISMIPQLAWGARQGGIAVLLYTPGRATIGGVDVVSETRYPADGKVVLTLNPGAEERFPVFLRVPRWTSRFTATAGGKTYSGKPGGYLEIARAWKPGDTIMIAMDLTVQWLDGGKSYPGYIAAQRGPQVLAAEAAVNPGLALDGATARRVARLRSLPSALPAGWGGDQAYAVESGAGGKLVLVPFSDGQEMRVWIKPAR